MPRVTEQASNKAGKRPHSLSWLSHLPSQVLARHSSPPSTLAITPHTQSLYPTHSVMPLMGFTPGRFWPTSAAIFSRI